MRKLLIIISIIVLIIVYTCSGWICYGCYIQPVIWEIDKKHEEYLEENFQIYLPQEYEFVYGRKSMDDWNYLHFVVTENDFSELLGEKWVKSHGKSKSITFSMKSIKGEFENFYYNEITEDDKCFLDARLYYEKKDDKVHCYLEYMHRIFGE